MARIKNGTGLLNWTICPKTVGSITNKGINTFVANVVKSITTSNIIKSIVKNTTCKQEYVEVGDYINVCGTRLYCLDVMTYGDAFTVPCKFCSLFNTKRCTDVACSSFERKDYKTVIFVAYMNKDAIAHERVRKPLFKRLKLW